MKSMSYCTMCMTFIAPWIMNLQFRKYFKHMDIQKHALLPPLTHIFDMLVYIWIYVTALRFTGLNGEEGTGSETLVVGTASRIKCCLLCQHHTTYCGAAQYHLVTKECKLFDTSAHTHTGNMNVVFLLLWV